MPQASGLNDAQVEVWRANIRHDIQTNYTLGMALAVYCQEGADKALPWLSTALAEGTSCPSAHSLLLAEILNDLNRSHEAEELLCRRAALDKGWEVPAIAYLMPIAIQTSRSDAITDRMLKRSKALDAGSGSSRGRLRLAGIQARIHIRREEWAAAEATICTICAVPVHMAALNADIVAELSLVASELLRRGQYRQVAPLDAWLLRAIDAGKDVGEQALPPDVPKIIQRLMACTPVWLGAGEAMALLPIMLRMADWSHPVLREKVVPYGIALLNQDLTEPVQMLYGYLTSAGPVLRNIAAWLLAEIVLCDADAERHGQALVRLIEQVQGDAAAEMSLSRALLAAGMVGQANDLADVLLDRKTGGTVAPIVKAKAAILAGDGDAVHRYTALLAENAEASRQVLHVKTMLLLTQNQIKEASTILAQHETDKTPAVTLLRALTYRFSGLDDAAQAEIRALTKTLSANALRRLINLSSPLRQPILDMLAWANESQAISRSPVEINDMSS